MLVVVALVVLALVGYSAYRRANLPKDCVSRLVLVDEAITRWATENSKDNLALPTEAELAGFLDDRSLLRCPDGGNYALGTRALATTCSKHGHASFVFVVPPRSVMNDLMREFSFWMGGRVLHCGNSCIANLKQLEGATAQWAMEHNKRETDIPPLDELYGATNYIRAICLCPQGGKYVFRSFKEKSYCTVVGHTL